ncbi:MAG TPA: hypothetical protein VLY65_02440 [Nitrososphaerales archaeon]|nr:hypothetical protein [Nitrososphaerales archaeon]
MSQPSSGKPLVAISVFLFGKPAWEIDGLEGAPVDLQLLSAIAACGAELNRRLSREAEVGKRLVANGWEGYGLLYSIEFYKAVTLKEAEDELRRLRVQPDEVSLREEFEEPED